MLIRSENYHRVYVVSSEYLITDNLFGNMNKWDQAACQKIFQQYTVDTITWEVLGK